MALVVVERKKKLLWLSHIHKITLYLADITLLVRIDAFVVGTNSVLFIYFGNVLKIKLI